MLAAVLCVLYPTLHYGAERGATHTYVYSFPKAVERSCIAGPAVRMFLRTCNSRQLSTLDGLVGAALYVTHTACYQSRLRPALMSSICALFRCVSSGELKAPWTAKAVPKPVITVTDESGNKADVTLYNIWAGNVRCCCACRPCSHNM
jgi:hypothetical protein